jgi:YVTN family beta-propeller protein
MRRGRLVVSILAPAVLLIATACSSGTSSHPADSAPGRIQGGRSAVGPPGRIEGGMPLITAPKRSTDVYDHTRAGQLSPAVAGVPSRVYVPNSESNTVDVIDPATFAVVDHFPVGALPQHVTPAWDLKTLYVDNDAGNSLTPIDPVTGRPGTPIPVDDPYNLYFTPDGSRAVVVAEKLRRLDFRDAHTWQVVKSLAVPCQGVDHADFTADGTVMIVSCEFSGQLLEIDVASMSLRGTLKIGAMPQDVKLSPDGQVVYVANGKDGVDVIDPVGLRQVGFIPTGKNAHGLYVSRDSRFMYVSNRGAKGAHEGTVSLVDLAARTVAATWPIGGSPDMGGVSADGTQLWLSGRYDQSVYVVDTTTGALLHTIKVGNGPHGLCVFPQPGRYSIGHTGVFR